MDRQLSQQEIDAVFQKADGRDDAPSRKAVPFDFRRPDRIAKSQLRAIHLLHENFVRNLASSLSAYLRSYLTVNLISVEQLSYCEFVSSLSSPSCLVSLALKPYDGNALVELTPNLIFPILEIILGGKGKAPSSLKREVTEIEQSLLDGLFRIILNDLKEAWKAVTAIDFQMEALETDPQMMQILAPNEAVVAVAIEIRIGENSGTMNMALPSINIKMIGQKFDQQWSLRKTRSSDTEQDRMLALIQPAKVRVDAALTGPMVTVRDLLALKAGDILTFDIPTERPVAVFVNGLPKLSGHIRRERTSRALLICDTPGAAPSP